MRWAPTIFLALALVALPNVGGQAVGEQVPEIIVGATLDIQHRVSLAAAELSSPAAGLVPMSTEEGDPCSQPADITASDDEIVFTDTNEYNGCAWATLNLSLPQGATSLTLRFNASRTVTNPDTDVLTNAVLIDQALFLDAGREGDLRSQHAYIARETSTKAGAVYERSFSVGGAGSHSPVTFWFHDVGSNGPAQQAAVLIGQAVTARVHSVQALFSGIAIEDRGIAQVTARQNISATEEQLTISQSMEVPEVNITGGLANLQFTLRGTDAFLGGFDAQGNAASFTNTTIQDIGSGLRQVSVAIAPGELQSSYEWRFARQQAIPVAPTQFGDYGPMYFLALGFGGVASGGAMFATVKYNRIAQGSYRTSALRMAIGLAVLVLYFLFQAIYTWVVITPRGMIQQPLQQQALTFYVQMLLVILALSSLWYIVARTEVRRMRTDIKERQQREAELKRSNAELEQFAYVASHDLQEPLRKVASYTQLLQRKYVGELDEEAHEFIEYAVSGAKRMQNLITDILQFSRVGQNELKIEPVDLNQLLKEIKGDLQVRLEETKGRIIAKDLPIIATDTGLARQLLYNLVNNGIKFHRATARPVVRVSSEKTDAGYRIRIADNGIGIAKQHHERIFSVFKRLHRHEEYAGTGIGLALCRKIADLLGGTISVESEVGRGSTFILDLPESTA